MTCAEPPVLVSGGAGYLGSHVVLALVEAGYRPVVLDDLSGGHREAVPDTVPLVVADAGDAHAVRALIAREGICAAVHLACAPGVGQSAGRVRRSTRASAAFVAACAESGVRRFVLTSSAAVYAAPGGAPGGYGAGKRRTEGRVRAAFGGAGRSHAVLRCFNVVGADTRGRAGPRRPAERGGLVEAACEAALGLRPGVTVFGTDYDTADGTCVRDYVHPSDAAAAHVAALRMLERGAASVTADCGTGIGRSVREVLAAVERRSGASFAVRDGPRRAGDVACAVAAPERMERLADWRPRHVDIEATVSTALAWREALAREAPAAGARR